MRNRYLMALGGLMIAAFVAMACGSDDNGNGATGATGTGATGATGGATGATGATGTNGDEAPSLEGVTLTVGSKEFTEQVILGKIAVLALENAGATVDDSTGITGTVNVRAALDAGEIDMYWEYTGTGWSTLLGLEISEAPDTAQALWEAVAEQDLENGIVWLDPADLNNTYALVTAAARAEEMGVTTISEFAELANTSPEEATLCAATEWLTRDDGYPGLEEAYSFTLAANLINEFADTSPIAALVAAGNECNFGELFATDGTISPNDLVILEDDLEYFVAYNVAMTIRQDVFDEHGEALEAVFGPITAALTDEVMQELNARVDAEGELEEDVAEDWLRTNGFID